jgi:hypothetical protein
MEYATLNGVPIITYGLIGATTMFLAYSVFRDETSPKPADTDSIFNIPTVSMPSVSLPTVALPAVALPTAAMFATKSESESEKESVKEPVADDVPVKEPDLDLENSQPALTQGGKSKHTRNKRKHRNKNKKGKRTKHNRK